MDLQRSQQPAGQDSPQRKRRKGAQRMSCAECRRLKLRCDRAIPCSSCVKRGCGQICPDGSLTTGQGNRFVLASTQELHEKISELSTRVRELEDALRSSHTQLSPDQHPLLTDDLLKIKAPLQRELPAMKNSTNLLVKEEEGSTDVVDAFGSLSLSLSGRAKYYGQIANSWYFLQNEAEEEEHDERLANLQNILPPKILARAAAFPIAPVAVQESDPANLQSLFWYLPSAEKASELRSIYYRQAAWMYNPISRESFDYEVYSQFYDPNVNASPDDPLLSHRLSIMFMVLAIGTLVDTSQPAYSMDAEKYNQLGRAALFQTAFFESPTVNAVQALYLMIYYLFLADRQSSSSGARWALMGIAVKVAQSIGLHRDSGRWNGVDPVETQRRRELFWELFTYDSWCCLTFSRPPSFALIHVDCKMPHVNDPSEEQTFHAWKHRFVSECMNLMHDQAFNAKTPNYATVLQLDRKLRAHPVPPILQIVGFGNTTERPGGYPETFKLTLQRHIVLAIRESNLLYLHRSFFARAISDHPKDPLGSQFGTSVIAAYRSACSLVALMRNLYAQLPEQSARLWFLWTHMFSCSIVLGSIVTRCPSMSLAPSALVQLDSACELFSKAARGFGASKVLSIMLSLRDRAHASLDDFRKGKGSPISSRHNSMMEPGSPTDENDELAMLGGKTRLVKQEPSSPLMIDQSPTSHHPVIPFPQSSSATFSDPNVLAYLQSFQPSSSMNHQQPPLSAGSQQSFSDVEQISPVSMYGLSSLSPQGSFHAEPPTFGQQPQSPFAQTSHHGNHGNGMMTNGHQTNSIPQYFPVYDYGHGVQMDTGYNTAPLLEMNPMPGPQRRSSSGSPEGNTMQSTWTDFVAGLTN